MKTIKKTRFAAFALSAIFGSVGLLSTAHAIPFTWIDGPLAGQTFAGGAIEIKAFNYDTGTLYNALPQGTSVGYSGDPGPGVAGGEAALNGIVARQALGAQNGEDSWGIIKITDVFAKGPDGVTNFSIYNHLVNSFELTALFWGVNDFYVEQVSAGNSVPGSGQVIDGTGLRVDIYMDSTKDFSQTAGPLGGHPGNTYATVTDGSLELSLLSTPGFINPNGTFGGVATEFESNTANVGYAALNVIGGSAETVAQFDTNGIGFKGSSGASFIPGLAGQTSTDVWFAFTATQGDSGWDVKSNDPMLANISTTSVPDSGATLLMLGCALPLIGFAARRHSRATAV